MQRVSKRTAIHPEPRPSRRPLPHTPADALWVTDITQHRTPTRRHRGHLNPA